MFPSLHMFDSVGPRSPEGGMMPQQAKAAGPMMPGTQPASRRRGGMFGNVDWQRLGALLMASTGNQAGQIMLQQMGEREQAERQAQAQSAARQQQMADQWSMWQRQQEFQRANPMPGRLEREIEGLDRALASGQISAEEHRVARLNLLDPVRSNFAVVNGQPGFINQRTSQIGGSPAPAGGLSDDEFDALGEGGSGSAAPSNFPGIR